MVGWLAGHVGAEVLLDRGSLHGLAVHAPVPAIWSHCTPLPGYYLLISFCLNLI